VLFSWKKSWSLTKPIGCTQSWNTESVTPGLCKGRYWLPLYFPSLAPSLHTAYQKDNEFSAGPKILRIVYLRDDDNVIAEVSSSCCADFTLHNKYSRISITEITRCTKNLKFVESFAAQQRGDDQPDREAKIFAYKQFLRGLGDHKHSGAC
jgi:hypothetical protein